VKGTTDGGGRPAKNQQTKRHSSTTYPKIPGEGKNASISVWGVGGRRKKKKKNCQKKKMKQTEQTSPKGNPGGRGGGQSRVNGKWNSVVSRCIGEGGQRQTGRRERRPTCTGNALGQEGVGQEARARWESQKQSITPCAARPPITGGSTKRTDCGERSGFAKKKTKKIKKERGKPARSKDIKEKNGR